MKMKELKQGFFLAFFILIINLGLMAQVEVVADGRLQTILEQHITFNEIARTAPGYRIRIGLFSGAGSKQKAFQLRDEVSNNFPQERVYVLFEEPNFIVKLGDYITKLDAFRTHIKLKGIYPNTVIIRDYINFPVLSNEDLVIPEYYEEETE